MLDQAYQAYAATVALLRMAASVADAFVCAVAQIEAAQDMCSSVPSCMKAHYLQTGVGHYGVFAGRRWRTQIYPIIREFIRDNETRHAAVCAAEGDATVC
jgi:poly-beta-hydroxyalkanoate depolymerase